MGTAVRNNESMVALWCSIMPMHMSMNVPGDDKEILKLALLLKSTDLLFTELRQKHLSASSQLQSVTNQLTSLVEEKKQNESKIEALKKDLLLSKSQLQSAEDRAKKFQKDAEAASVKCERLQGNISAEVEARLLSMFKNCMRQNKAATLQEMMTQMYPETQLPESGMECGSSELDAAYKPLKQLTHLNNVSSPDVIQPTPPHWKTGRKNTSDVKKQEQKIECKLISATQHSAPSSPEIIAGTPSPCAPSFKKKDNKKRHERLRELLKHDSQSNEKSEKDPVIYVKDTQDVDEDPVTTARLALRENIIIPETLNPSSCDEEEKEGTSCDVEGVKCGKKMGNERHSFERKGSSPIKEKENWSNGKVPSKTKEYVSGKGKEHGGLLPVEDTELHSTPKKSPTFRERSPILGNSGSKKIGTWPVNPTNLTEKSRRAHGNASKTSGIQKNTSILNDSGVSESFNTKYSLTKAGKVKRSRQPSIEQSIKMMNSKLSLSAQRKKKDISKQPGFNGGQRFGEGVSLNISHLSENEQIELAITNSIQESSHSSVLEDSDATLFEPANDPQPRKKKKTFEESTPCVPSLGKLNSTQNPNDERERSSLPSLFEPLFASTAKEDYRDFPSDKHLASSEEDSAENSRLDMLAEHLDDFVKDADNAPLYSSYDRIPKGRESPNYAYQGPTVRKKADRKNLRAVECTQCGEFFAVAFGDIGPDEKEQIINSCSRHRVKHSPVKSPPRMWDLEMPSSEYIREKLEQPTQ